MRYLIAAFLLISFCGGHDQVLVVAKDKLVGAVQSKLKEQVEYAYFSGQRDALRGDVRIEKRDSCFVWTKSPWDNDSSKLSYIPPCGKDTLRPPIDSGISSGSSFDYKIPDRKIW
jgi:hypothetical protein